MAKKKNRVSFAEEEMAAYAQGQPDIHEDRSEIILRIIRQHEEELNRAAAKYLKLDSIDQYSRYSEAAAAIYNLKEALRMEGFRI